MIKPMLAHKYAPHKVSFPAYVQPKLNGVRGVFIPGQHFQSRYGEIWNAPVVAHAFSALTGIKFHLDGEFYLHGMSLQNINSRIGVVRNGAHVESERIQFHVFDVIIDAPFHKRALLLAYLGKQLNDNPFVKVVETRQVSSDIEADHWYGQWKHHDNYEGMMYRDADMTYGFAQRCGNKDNRWNCLLKRKEMVDLEATICGFNEMLCGATGEPKGTLGSFELMTAQGARFSAGSGLTNSLRETYWKLGLDKMFGTKVRINYEMLSDGGVPLKPIIELVDYIL